MREIPAWARVLMLGACAAVLVAAFAGAGTSDDPYAPNDWLFSHEFLADLALEEGELPLNRDLLTENGFAETMDRFQQETGLERMTFYANTVWHFWNGLPLHPALLAGLAALTGLEVEQASRLPLGAIAVLLLVYASADLLVPRASRAAHVAPFAIAVVSAPFLLDTRTLMPSAALLVVGILLHLLLRRQLEDDRWALAYAIVPLALLPFWYYTVSYFVIVLFAGFLLAAVAMRLLKRDERPVVPILVAALVPAALAGILLLNGALTSHVIMAKSLGGSAIFAGESGTDYERNLNRETWRSGVLYAQLAILFLPLALLGLHALARALRRRSVEPAPAIFAQWSVGAGLFTLALQQTVGISFLNRGVIYLTPIAVLAAVWAASRMRVAKAALGVTLSVGAVASAALVATAAPSYEPGDATGFTWIEQNVPKDAVVYGPLDASSVLFRAHGFTQAIAFHPREALLEEFWYGTDPERMVRYLASVEWVVLRDDVRTRGFEEYGPLREPITEEAYAKFGASPDLHLVYDNGAIEVFQVELDPSRLRGFGP